MARADFLIRVLTLRCKEPGCEDYAQVSLPKGNPVPRYRVLHEADGTHTLQQWVEPEPKESDLTWDKSKWK